MNIKFLFIFLVLPFVAQTQDLPKVFMMGEYETEYNQMLLETSGSLLTVCGNDMNVAYDKWVQLVQDIEKSSLEASYDIRGIKIWINVFFGPDGQIKHIVYHPKPNSKNLDYAVFTEFLNDFSENYSIETSADTTFVHYGSASFPTFFHLEKK